MPDPARIDVHQHILPPGYRELLTAGGTDAGGWPLPAWTADRALALMDRHDIATGMLSVSAPGTHFGDDAQARELTRAVNEYTADLVRARPDRFGQFASVPLPDVEGAIAEAAYALDELHADGIVVLTNAGGHYLGDALFEPLWAELNTRAAVVFVHPTAPAQPMLPGIPAPVVDFPFDTTRAAAQLALAGVPGRYPRIRTILAHAGGAVPYLAYRIAVAGASAYPTRPTIDSVLDHLRNFHFDTALSASPAALSALLAFAAPGHILYGSDWPFAPEEAVTYFTAHLETYPGEPDDRLQHVNRRNAEALFPRLTR